MTTIFKTPFATQGDKASIPVEIQPDGSVSYTQGYGYDYERDQVTDPAAKDIEREKMNGIFHDITEAIGEIQAFGFPKWDEVGKPYAIRTIVYHKNKVWQSKVENNNIEPVAGNAWAELKADATAGDVGAYSKTESDQRFQPLGNYQASGYSYSKAESDTKFQPKGNYAPAGNYANKGDSYTKTESDGRYQAKGNYQPSGNYALVGASYTKIESDGRYQTKGSYQPAGNYADKSSTAQQQFTGGLQGMDNVISRAKNGNTFGVYVRDEKVFLSAYVNGSWKGEVYHPLRQGTIALQGDSYTKTESDGRYQPKGSYQVSGYSYSKSESDARYQPKGNYAPAGNYGAKNTASKAKNGWWKCGDTGIIYQWGQAKPAYNAELSVNFPIKFPNAVFSVVGSVNDSIAKTSDSAICHSITTSGFKLRVLADSTWWDGTSSWLAIGY